MKSWKKVAVVGAGHVGSGVAQKIATEGYPVVMVDATEEQARAAMNPIRDLLAEGITRQLFTEDVVARILSRLRPTGDLLDVAECDLVIEAVTEDRELKAELLRKIGKIVRPEAAIATTTCTLGISDLAQVVASPRRFLGLHFFHDPVKNRLVEVVPGKLTSRNVFGDAWRFLEVVGKTPIHTLDQAGFAINRFIIPWFNEAVRLVDEQVANRPTIDEAARRAFGIERGPFELMNLLGVDLVLAGTRSLAERLGPLYSLAGSLGEQAGAAWDLAGESNPTPSPEVVSRLQAAAFLVAAELVDQGVCTREDLDIGVREGLRWTQGPFELMNHFGPRKAHDQVRDLASGRGIELPKSLAVKARDDMPFPIRHVNLRIKGNIATVRLNRPDTHNALRPGVLRQLARCFDEAVAHAEVKTIVLEGAGKFFCAGTDVSYLEERLAAGAAAEIQSFARRGHELLQRIATCPKTVIATLNGPTLGGGCELALCCDLVVTSERARLGFPQIHQGLPPYLGGSQRLSDRTGPGLARYLIYTGNSLDAADALEIGLVDEVVTAAELDERVQSLARHLTMATRSPRSYSWDDIEEVFEGHSVEELLALTPPEDSPEVAAGLLRMREASPRALQLAEQCLLADREEAGFAAELRSLEELLRTEDVREGLRAYLEGRAPRFADR